MQTIARTVPPSNEDKHFWISMATRNLQVRISSEGLMWSKRFWLGINHSWTKAALVIEIINRLLLAQADGLKNQSLANHHSQFRFFWLYVVKTSDKNWIETTLEQSVLKINKSLNAYQYIFFHGMMSWNHFATCMHSLRHFNKYFIIFFQSTC